MGTAEPKSLPYWRLDLSEVRKGRTGCSRYHLVLKAPSLPNEHEHEELLAAGWLFIFVT